MDILSGFQLTPLFPRGNRGRKYHSASQFDIALRQAHSQYQSRIVGCALIFAKHFKEAHMDDFDQMLLVVAITWVAYAVFQRRRNWLELPFSKFWEIAARADRPLVLISMRGWLRNRPCYLFPYHGFVFYTWTRPPELPPGVSLVAPFELSE